MTGGGDTGPDALLRLLETDASLDIRKIDIPPSEEDKITLDLVMKWYIAVEKIIRVIGNMLPSPMTQSINQLRYAGHHVLKYATATGAQGEPYRKSNLIEAYKHCKRAHYDAIDTYVFHLLVTFRDAVRYLSEEHYEPLAKKLETHIAEVDAIRTRSDDRIGYYSEVFDYLPGGLRLIYEVNLQLSQAGINVSAAKTNAELSAENTRLHRQMAEGFSRAEQRFNRFAFWTMIAVVIATAFGLVFQGMATAYFTTSTNHVYLRAPDPGGEARAGGESAAEGR